MANTFWSFWQIHAQTSFAGLPSSVWNAQAAIIRRVISNPGARRYWERYRHEFEEEFRREVERIASSGPPDHRA